MQFSIRYHAALPMLAAAFALLCGCHKSASPSRATTSSPASEPAKSEISATGSPEASVSLSAEDVKKLGVVTEDPKPAVWSPQTSGYAVVLSHEGIAQAVSELASAQAADRHSRAALARARALDGSAGALPAEARETAERQAGLDASTLALAERKLTALIGEHPPWPAAMHGDPLGALASGHIKLVRATFSLASALPRQLSAMRVNRIAEAPAESGWDTSTPWPGPADPAVPGRSFFALVTDPDVSEGEHLEAWTPVGAAQHGLRIPPSAVVQSEGKYWCYVEIAPGKYARTPMATLRPLDDGYFVTEGFSAGQRVVSSAAALLLARELNPSTEAQ